MIKIIEPIVNKIIPKIPEKTIKSKWWGNQIEKAGKYSSPESRLILGATAIATQPWIDFSNKDVDKETRKVSCARTIAKIIAGTFTGYYIRKWCIKSIDALTRTPEELDKLKQKPTELNRALIPTSLSRKEFAEAERLMKKHRGAIGTCLALLVMLFTNFLIDAPLTKVLTNVFVDKFNKSENKPSDTKGGQ